MSIEDFLVSSCTGLVAQTFMGLVMNSVYFVQCNKLRYSKSSGTYFPFIAVAPVPG